jgi:hypothetical protein
VYHAFENARKQIRLFSFSHDRYDDLRVEVFDIMDCPPFAAISYCWGTAEGARPIRLNNHPILKRPSVHNVLQAIFGQKHDGKAMTVKSDSPSAWTEYFWLDALCINQSDVIERGAQVSIMNEIYSRAEHVLVYLGGDGLNEALSHLRKWYREDKKRSTPTPWSESNPLEGFVYLGVKFDNPGILRPFFESNYWSRAWIMQEYALAKRVFFISSHEAIEFQFFAKHLWNAGILCHETFALAGREYSRLAQFEYELFGPALDGRILQPCQVHRPERPCVYFSRVR